MWAEAEYAWLDTCNSIDKGRTLELGKVNTPKNIK